MGSVSPDHGVFLVLGSALVVAAVAAWTGRWRRWAADELFRPYPITIAPPLGVLFVSYGISPLVPGPAAFLGVASLLAAAAGFVVGLADPAWFGPRWYRERDREPDLSIPSNAMIAATLPVPPERDSERTARRERAGVPLARHRASLADPEPRAGQVGAAQVVGGLLLLYPAELVFVADRAHDALRAGPTVRSRPSAGLTASVAGRGLRPDVIVGPGPDRWVVRSPRPRRLAAELNRRYGETPENPEVQA